jgi:pimeloyl-ACP methyl ester carboxylesterase
MYTLGFERFAVVRNDCGSCVAHRMALDHPEALERITGLATALPATLSGRTDNELIAAQLAGLVCARIADAPITPWEGMGSDRRASGAGLAGPASIG